MSSRISIPLIVNRNRLALPEALPPAIPITYASTFLPSGVYHGARPWLAMTTFFDRSSDPPADRDRSVLVLDGPADIFASRAYENREDPWLYTQILTNGESPPLPHSW